MKTKSINRIACIAITLLLGVGLMQVDVNAQDAEWSDRDLTAKGERVEKQLLDLGTLLAPPIVGVWNVQVTLTFCDSGAPLGPAIPALYKYELGGTGTVVPSANPAAVSVHQMVWQRLQIKKYRIALKFFRFDPTTGSAVGYSVIRGDIFLNNSGTEYTGSGRAVPFDMNGNPLPGPAVCPLFSATLFE